MRGPELDSLRVKWANALNRPWVESQVVGSTLEAHDNVVDIMKQAMCLKEDGQGGECVSSLLVGPRGVGKTFVVQSAIQTMQDEGVQVCEYLPSYRSVV